MFAIEKIVVGYDGSAGGKLALEAAAAIALTFRARVTALWVHEPLPHYSDLPGEFEEQVEAVNEYYGKREREVAQFAAENGTIIDCARRDGDPAKALTQFADEGRFDLIVVGHSGHSELWGRLLGDTADRIADHAHCSVLVVKPTETKTTA